MGEDGHPLRGKRVAFVGRLRLCGRESAARLVTDAGGRVVGRGARADLWVLGAGTKARAGAGRALSESRFLALLAGAGEVGAGELGTLFPAATVGTLYPRLTWARRRALAGRHLVHPVALPAGSAYRFDDLLVLKAVDELLAAGFSFSDAVKRVEPRVRGQLDFGFPKPAGRPRPMRVELERAPESADSWFDIGFVADRDRQSFPTAIAAYERALAIDPDHVPSLINLGNIHYEVGEFARAREIYARACAVDADNPRTHFNLGNACDETGDLLGAARAYRRALALWPEYADAHFNLALVAEKLASRGIARHHWRRFLELEPESEWASAARARLAEMAESDANSGPGSSAPLRRGDRVPTETG